MKVLRHDKIVQMAAKNKAPERWPATLLTLSRLQEKSGCLNFNKWSKSFIIDFLMHNGIVRVAEGNELNRPS
jgi:hypothetical protein